MSKEKIKLFLNGCRRFIYKSAPYFTLVALFNHVLLLNAQELKTVIPPSPNVAALGKYLETPVSYYTGVPQISIPIYEINSGRIKVPVSLDYHAGGIKVEECASWVGLGWNLNVGGAITRTVRGRPDESTNGYINNGEEMTVNQLINGPADISNHDLVISYNQRMVKSVRRVIDAEPDLFYLSAPGLGFKFYYNQETKRFYADPASKAKIEFFGEENTNFRWVVTAPNGLVYSFESSEYTTSTYDPQLGIGNTITAWMLNSIYDPATSRMVIFDYVPVLSYGFANGVSEVSYFPLTTGGSISAGGLIYQDVVLHPMRLSKITFDQGEIDFVPQQAPRLDMPSNSEQALGRIILKNRLGNLVKRYMFKTSYFMGGSANIPPPNGSLAPALYSYRLRLDSLAMDIDSLHPQVYSFTYNPGLCNRLSLDQDEWGYYNGANNLHLVHEADFMLGEAGLTHLIGGNRNTNPSVNQMGILKKIEHPTGGSTEFEYETNRYTVKSTSGPAQELLESRLYAHPVDADYSQPAYSYTEIPFHVSGGGYPAGYAWGEVIQLDGSVEYCPSQFQSVNCYVEGTDPGNAMVSYGLNGPNHVFYLPPGNYKLVAEFKACEWQYFEMARAVLVLKDYFPVGDGSAYAQQYVGGLRVKSITDQDPLTGRAMKREYEYSSREEPLLSSGTIPSKMRFDYEVMRTESQGGDLMTYYKRQSYSSIPLATIKGSSIGYSIVREKYLNDGLVSGFTEYHYSTEPDISDERNVYDFFRPITNRDFMRGELLGKYVYGIKDGSPVLLQSVENEYKSIADSTQPSISQGMVGAPCTQGSGNDIPIESVDFDFASNNIIPLQLGYYKEFQDRSFLSRSVEKNYAMDGAPDNVALVTEYDYSPNNFEVARTIRYLENATGEKEVVNVRYTGDLDLLLAPVTDPAELSAVAYLGTANDLNEVIERSVSKEHGGTSHLVDLQRNAFNDNLLLKRVDRLKTATTGAPVLEPRLFIDAYDGNGNIVTQKMSDNTNNSFIWGYDGGYPVAKIVGGDYYTAAGLVNFNIVGDAVHNTDEDVWAELNKIRTGMPGAQVWTYTYKPMIGMTSETDPKGNIVHYKYDDIGRLVSVWDAYGKLLKKICYNLKGQPTDCAVLPPVLSFSNQEKTAIVYKNNCAEGSEGGSVVYTVPAGTYTSTVSQADADMQAQNDINQNSQDYANAHAACTSTRVYAQIRMENITTGTESAYGDLVVRFFADEGCTIPKDYCTEFTVTYHKTNSACGCGTTEAPVGTQQYCGANEEVLYYGATIFQEIDYIGHYEEYEWYVMCDDPNIVFK